MVTLAGFIPPHEQGWLLAPAVVRGQGGHTEAESVLLFSLL